MRWKILAIIFRKKWKLDKHNLQLESVWYQRTLTHLSTFLPSFTSLTNYGKIIMLLWRLWLPPGVSTPGGSPQFRQLTSSMPFDRQPPPSRLIPLIRYPLGSLLTFPYYLIKPLGLRHSYAGSSTWKAETRSLDYRPASHLLLLPTLAYANAVTVSFRAGERMPGRIRTSKLAVLMGAHSRGFLPPGLMKILV